MSFVSKTELFLLDCLSHSGPLILIIILIYFLRFKMIGKPSLIFSIFIMLFITFIYLEFNNFEHVYDEFELKNLVILYKIYF
jgi:hypothetical protein